MHRNYNFSVKNVNLRTISHSSILRSIVVESTDSIRPCLILSLMLILSIFNFALSVKLVFRYFVILHMSRGFLLCALQTL